MAQLADHPARARGEWGAGRTVLLRLVKDVGVARALDGGLAAVLHHEGDGEHGGRRDAGHGGGRDLGHRAGEGLGERSEGEDHGDTHGFWFVMCAGGKRCDLPGESPGKRSHGA